MAAFQIGQLFQRQNRRLRQRFIHYLAQQLVGIICILFQLRPCQDASHILFLQIRLFAVAILITVCVLCSVWKCRFQPAEERLPFLIVPLFLTLALQQKPQQFHRFPVTFTLQHHRKLDLVVVQRLRKQHDILIGGGIESINEGTSFSPNHNQL
ncbi:hypothetical protein D3C73_1252390 [compost metagenome]